MISQLLTNNPYRVLGVYSNSPKRDVLSNLNKMKAFLKVGKTVSFPLDLPEPVPFIDRNEDLVSSAQGSIELPMDQLKHTLFWFMKDTSLDDIAFNHLIVGHIDKAKEIWNNRECVSSLLNLMVCAMIEGNDADIAIYADKLFQKHSEELCLTVNETLKLTSSELTELFVDLLKNDGSINLAKLIRIPGVSSEWQKIVGALLVRPIIDEITIAISEAKEAQGPTANYLAGEKLMNSTKDSLSQLKTLLGESDMQYQMIADKLAETILQCGINYFNGSEEDENLSKAMVLLEFALSISIGMIVKQRCAENVGILKEIEKSLPPLEIKEDIKEANRLLKDIHKDGNI